MKTRENTQGRLINLPLNVLDKNQISPTDNLPKSKEDFEEYMQKMKELVALQKMAKLLEFYFS